MRLMSKDSQIIDTKSLYVNPERGVATLNYSQNYFTDIPSLVNSDEVKQIVKLYLDSRNPDNDDDAFDNASVDKFIDVLKKILFDDDSAFDEYDPKDILASVEELYSYYRSLLRVSVISYNDNKIVGNEFRTIDTQFNDLVRKLYRILEESRSNMLRSQWISWEKNTLCNHSFFCCYMCRHIKIIISRKLFVKKKTGHRIFHDLPM